MKKRIRKWLREFLGINDLVSGLRNHGNRLSAFESLTNIAVDVNLHIKRGANTQIIVVSHLKQGMVRVIDMRFDNYSELMGFVKMLENSYKPYLITFNGPDLDFNRIANRNLGRQD